MGGPPEMNVAALQQEVAAFNAQRGWATVHTVESLCVAVSVESGELLEVTLWPKDGQVSRADLLSEMADVGIYLLSLANLLGISLEDAIRAKLEANSGRFPLVPDAQGTLDEQNEPT